MSRFAAERYAGGKRQQVGLHGGPLGAQPEAIGKALPLVTGAAGVLNSFSSCCDRQWGHSTTSEARTSSSKSWWQSWQRYSKIGMAASVKMAWRGSNGDLSLRGPKTVVLPSTIPSGARNANRAGLFAEGDLTDLASVPGRSVDRMQVAIACATPLLETNVVSFGHRLQRSRSTNRSHRFVPNADLARSVKRSTRSKNILNADLNGFEKVCLRKIGRQTIIIIDVEGVIFKMSRCRCWYRGSAGEAICSDMADAISSHRLTAAPGAVTERSVRDGRRCAGRSHGCPLRLRSLSHPADAPTCALPFSRPVSDLGGQLPHNNDSAALSLSCRANRVMSLHLSTFEAAPQR